MQEVAVNLKRVTERIAEAALRKGRDPSQVRLIGATKGVSPERILEAVEAGLRDIGENYVQEAQRKWPIIGTKVHWHMIGRLQTNKARHAVKLFECLHSLDNLELARELDKRAKAEGRKIKVLIQVNLSGEVTKAGIKAEEVMWFLEGISGFEGLEPIGLMTLPPPPKDPEDSRPFFRALRQLRDTLEEKGFRLPELSMGTSDDFEVAVEEGATMVRVGRAIFGERKLNYG